DADADGALALLDRGNGRVVRLRADGQLDHDVRLSMKEPRDVALMKDGSLAVLDARGGAVTLVTPEGKTRHALPLPPGAADHARSVVVSGRDVYVESSRGELTRIGDVLGNA